jgi:hypothetical protein
MVDYANKSENYVLDHQGRQFRGRFCSSHVFVWRMLPYLADRCGA